MIENFVLLNIHRRLIFVFIIFVKSVAYENFSNTKISITTVYRRNDVPRFIIVKKLEPLWLSSAKNCLRLPKRTFQKREAGRLIWLIRKGWQSRSFLWYYTSTSVEQHLPTIPAKWQSFKEALKALLQHVQPQIWRGLTSTHSMIDSTASKSIVWRFLTLQWAE